MTSVNQWRLPGDVDVDHGFGTRTSPSNSSRSKKKILRKPVFLRGAGGSKTDVGKRQRFFCYWSDVNGRDLHPEFWPEHLPLSSPYFTTLAFNGELLASILAPLVERSKKYLHVLYLQHTTAVRRDTSACHTSNHIANTTLWHPFGIQSRNPLKVPWRSGSHATAPGAWTYHRRPSGKWRSSMVPSIQSVNKETSTQSWVLHTSVLMHGVLMVFCMRPKVAGFCYKQIYIYITVHTHMQLGSTRQVQGMTAQQEQTHGKRTLTLDFKICCENCSCREGLWLSHPQEGKG